MHSPHLDALAGAGIRFDRAYCVAPQCSPSRSALATGRYPHSNGVMGLAHGSFGWDLAPEEQHVAALLSAQGYETHLFGLQHVSSSDERPGFRHIHGRGLGPDVSTQVSGLLRGPLPRSPLYIEVNLEEPHRLYDQGGVRPDDSRGVFVPPYLPDNAAAREEMAMLQGAICEADSAVGRILPALDEAGLSDATLVIFTTDHGLAMPRAKCTLYDPGIETALLMRWPGGGLVGGRTVPELISNVDLLPTLLDAVGAPLPGRVQGRSFLPLLRGETYSRRDAVYAEKTYHSYYDPLRAIRTERFKLIRNFETSFAVEVPGDVQQGAVFRSSVERYHGEVHPELELYDLEADPVELTNLSGQTDFAEVRRELEDRLWAWMRATDDPLLRGPIPSPAYRRSLEAQTTPWAEG